jgi:divalent metal cation (Fe/Co/Zn/Cd) transporter
VYLLFTAVLAAGIGIAWAALTDAAQMPWPAVVGLALAAAAISTLVERGIHHARLRRSRPKRRMHPRPRPDHPRKTA